METAVAENRPAVKQHIEKGRVSANIAKIIIDFCKEKVHAQSAQFTMTELEEYVTKKHQITPGSAGRILRDLKLMGRIQYDVISRPDALYRLWSVA
jgi:hypothetical protein